MDNLWTLNLVIQFVQDDDYETDIITDKGFNDRISKMIKDLTITDFGRKTFNYELMGKTYRGISVSFFSEVIEITIPILSNEFDYKLADILLRYLIFYTNGNIENQTFERVIDGPYDKSLESNGFNYFIVEKPDFRSGQLLKSEENERE